MLQHSPLNQVFQALADPTRRAMVERLCAGPASVSALAMPFSMSLSAVGQHLQVLEESGLVRTRKAGRVRTVELERKSFNAAEQWFEKHRLRWAQRFSQLEALLDEEEPISMSAKRRKR